MLSKNAILLIRMLTKKIRLATCNQLMLAKPAWNRRLIANLVGKGFLDRSTFATVVPEVAETALALWSPGEPPPDFGAVAWQGRRRLQQGKRNVECIVWATKKAVRSYGGIGGRLKQPWQVQHDLGVTATYLTYRKVAPQEARLWIGEDIYERDFRVSKNEKLADAFLVQDEQVERSIEFVGDYPANRLQGFHDFWAAKNTPYELR